MTYIIDSKFNELNEKHEMAFFRADVCLGSPQSFTLDEKREICEQIDASNAEIDAAMRADFQSLPPEGQARMLDLLEKADPDHFDWWMSILVGEMPSMPAEA